MNLSDTDRARLRAEEEARAEIRADLKRDARLAARPNVWTGFLLNIVVIGLGFLIIAEPVTAVAWFAVAVVAVWVIGWKAWLLLVAASLLHYLTAYARRYEQPQPLNGYPFAFLILLALFGLASLFMR